MAEKDDGRMDRMEGKIDAHIKESSTFHGEMRQFSGNMEKWVKAVSDKADRIDSRLDRHEKDLSAHGVGANNELTGRFMGWLGAIGACSGLIGFLVHKIMARPVAP